MFLLQLALFAPPALADVPPDTSEEEDTATEDDKGCATVMLSASLLTISTAAIAVGWRRRED